VGSGGERKEGVVCMITKEEVKRSLKKVGKNKAPGLSGVTAEMILVEEDLSVEWLVDVINGIVKEGHIPSEWRDSVLIPLYKGKGDPLDCGSYRGVKLLEHAMKVVKRVIEKE